MLDNSFHFLPEPYLFPGNFWHDGRQKRANSAISGNVVSNFGHFLARLQPKRRNLKDFGGSRVCFSGFLDTMVGKNGKVRIIWYGSRMQEGSDTYFMHGREIFP